MATNPVSRHILVDLTCPYCKKENSVAIKREVSGAEQAAIRCAYCQKSLAHVLPGPFMAGPFPK